MADAPTDEQGAKGMEVDSTAEMDVDAEAETGAEAAAAPAVAEVLDTPSAETGSDGTPLPPVPEASELPPETAADEAEGEDEVIQECDVLLSHMSDLDAKLFLLQYPLRPAYRPYGDQGELQNVYMKEKAQRLRFEYKLYQEEQYADECRGRKHQENHVLTSTAVANPMCSYALAVVHQGSLMLTPIHTINQLRPDLEDFEKQRQKSRTQSTKAAADQEAGLTSFGGDNSDQSGAEEARPAHADTVAAAPVRMQYTGIMRRGRGRGRPEAEAQLAAEPAEPWVKLDYFKPGSVEALDLYNRHLVRMAQQAAEEHGAVGAPQMFQKLDLNCDRRLYMNMMCSLTSQTVAAKDTKVEKDDGMSTLALSRMPPAKQVEAIIRRLQVASFNDIRKRLPCTQQRSDEELIQLCRDCALAVAGNWVLKSELVGFDGFEACWRDVFLYTFDNKKGRLKKPDFAKVKQYLGNIEDGTADEILRGFAEMEKATGDIVLKRPIDEEFLSQFPAFREENQAWWQKHIKEVTARSNSIERPRGPKQVMKQMALANATVRQRHHWVAEVRELLALGAKTSQEVQRFLQGRNARMVVKEEEVIAALENPQAEVRKVRHLWVLSKMGTEAVDKLRDILFQLLELSDRVSKETLLTEYMHTYGLRCTLSDFVVRQVLREVAEREEGDIYRIKTGMVGL